MLACAEIDGCLRREYFKKNEIAPLPEGKDDFTLYGHRLSSLFRTNNTGASWLMNRYQTSFFSKYSNPTLSSGAYA